MRKLIKRGGDLRGSCRFGTIIRRYSYDIGDSIIGYYFVLEHVGPNHVRSIPYDMRQLRVIDEAREITLNVRNGFLIWDYDGARHSTLEEMLVSPNMDLSRFLRERKAT